MITCATREKFMSTCLFHCRNFDREKKASYTFEVYAIDGGRYGPRTAEAQIEITILDINDNAPVFDQIPYRVNTSQNQGSGQFVTKVIATDADFNMNGDVRYSFSTSSVYFDIDSPSGIITTRQQLGSAAVGMHRLEIVATDRGQPALSSTGVAEIYVGSSGGSSDLRFSTLQYTASISESAPAGFRITQVSATFVTGSGTISYSIVSGNDDGAFYIAASTGRQSWPLLRLPVWHRNLFSRCDTSKFLALVLDRQMSCSGLTGMIGY